MTRRYFYKALIKRIKDGDSMEVTFDLGLNIFYTSDIRLNGIDTPESFRPLTPLEKQAGELVKKHIKELIEGKEVFIQTTKNSKYGDYLGDIYLNENDEISLNQVFLSESLARPYSGDKKIPWTSEQLQVIIDNLS